MRSIGASVAKGRTTVQAFAIRQRDRVFREAALKRSIERERGFHEERDRKSFENAALPSGEELRIGCVWVFEAFLSSHSDALHRRLEALGLHRRFGSEESATEALERSRKRIHRGGGRPLGYLVPRSREGFSLGRKADLPLGVESVFFELHMISSSTSILSAQFRFDEQTARSIEEPLKTLYQTCVRRTHTGFAIPSGSHLREDAVKELRAMLRRRCVRWMNSNLPGAFAELQLGESPSVELLTMLVGDPRLGKPVVPKDPAPTTEREPGEASQRAKWKPSFPKAHGTEDMTYLTYLSADHSEAWEGMDFPGYTVRLPSWNEVSHEHLSMSVRVQGIDLLTDREARTPDTAVSHAYWLSKSLSLFALNRLIRVYEARFNDFRDRLARVRLTKPAKAIRELARIGRDMFAVTRDIRPFCHELKDLDENSLARWDVYTFTPLDEEHYEKPLPSLFRGWAKDALTSGQRLLTTEGEVRSTLESMTDLAAAEVNIAVARSNNRLQVFVAILTIVTAILAYLALPATIREEMLRIVGVGN